MVCYPLLLLVAGLEQLNLPKTTSKSIKNLLQNCDEIDNTYYHNFQAFKNNERENGKHKIVKKYEIINKIHERPLPLAMDKSEKYVEAPEYFVKEKSKTTDNNNVSKKKLRAVTKTSTYPDVTGLKVLNIPIITDEKQLLKSFKDRVPLVAMWSSDVYTYAILRERLLKGQHLYLHLIGFNLDVTNEVLGISTRFIANLIVQTLKYLKKSRSEYLNHVWKNHGDLYEAAQDFLKNTKEDPGLEKYFVDYSFE